MSDKYVEYNPTYLSYLTSDFVDIVWQARVDAVRLDNAASRPAYTSPRTVQDMANVSKG